MVTQNLSGCVSFLFSWFFFCCFGNGLNYVCVLCGILGFVCVVWLMTVGERRVDEVVEVVRYLGAEDLKFLDSLRRKRRLLGFIFIVAGFGVLVGVMFYVNLTGTENWLWFIFGLFMGSLLMREGNVAIQEAKSIAIPGGGRYRVFSKVVCSNASCGYSEIRERRPGEYVGMVLDAKCPKCGSNLVVDAIFGEPEKKLKTIGLPLLPGMQQASLLKLLGYYIVDMFSPLKIAFRVVRRRLSGGEGGEEG